jgi:NTE family protein
MRSHRFTPACPGLAATLLFALTALTAPTPSAAQVPAADPPARPRIGLALSGGGARGAAHIGVLRVLDELRVPIDCIAGTSMGAVVGGSFASGTTPDEMQKVIERTDWNEVFTDRPPRAEIATRRKQDDYKNLFAPEFGFRDGSILLPKGVVAGVNIESFLRYLTEQSRNVDDFSRLPIPFRAVAADIETGQAVILSKGNLPEAMRASMSIPGAVAPVQIDGRLLVDGGIANNLPINVVREVCAEVVIAVNISTPPLKRDEITSALSIVAQLINFLGKDTVDRQLAGMTPRDVLISPELGDISSGSFERQGEAIGIGEAAARQMADQLARYSLPPEQYAALRKTQVVPHGRLGQVGEIRFEGVERTNEAVLAALVESKPGEDLDEEKLRADLRRIYGRGDFEAVGYSIQQDDAGGSPALVIKVREKEIGPDYLRFGLALASDFKGDSYFNALVSYRRTWLNKFGAEWLAEAQVGQNSYFFTEFYQPLEERGRLFVAPYGVIGQFTRGIFVGDDRVAEYRVKQADVGLDLGAALGTWGEVRFGPVFRWINAEVDTGPPALPDVRVNASGLRFKLFGDRQDTAFFARSGESLRIDAYEALTALGADQGYRRAQALWTGSYSFGPHTLNGTLMGGSGFGSDLPAYDAFTLGGPFRLSGYRINQFAGDATAFAMLRYYHQILRLPSLLGSGIYVGASAEVGRMNGLYTESGSSSGTLYSGSAFIGAESFLGPAYLGVGFGGGGNVTAYFLLGVPW